jgi:beta-N-acetylhexosaminidase
MTDHAPLILDIAGTELTDTDRARLAHPLTGGMILFGRNWRDRRQLTRLCADIKAVRDDLLICVDHEGGRVQRFRTDGFTHLPPMRVLGELWMRDALAATNAATAAGYVLGAELRACGVDFSFTPVLDLDWGGSGVIGDRAFHKDARVVAMLAKSLMHGLLQAGVANCGKHFPGHGFVKADSHTEIPVDNRSLKAILADDAAPYGWLNTTLTSVMPAHVVYPKVDALPAGFSPRWLQAVLRDRLGSPARSSATTSAWKAPAASRARPSATPKPASPRCRPVATWCCCATSRSARAATSTTARWPGRGAGQGSRWTPDPASEQRRLALLPVGTATEWDDLMVQPATCRRCARCPEARQRRWAA